VVMLTNAPKVAAIVDRDRRDTRRDYPVQPFAGMRHDVASPQGGPSCVC
jgi:hypothetical protein